MSLLNNGARRAPVHFQIETPASKKQALIRHFSKTLREKGLLEPGQSVLVAVSGGADSMCLLHLFSLIRKEWDLDLRVAHFEHGLRGEESRKDACFVEERCRQMGLEFHMGVGDVKALSRQKGMSVQEAARILRYRFFDEIMEEYGIDRLATGHTSNDQAEEVLLRLIRGADLAGLGGIPWRRGSVIRPLLDVTRKQILEHLKAFNVDFVEDSSNQSTVYVRNRIRKVLIPLIEEEFNPAINETLTKTAERLSEEREALSQVAEKGFSSALVRREEDELVFEIKKLELFPAAIRRWIFRQAVIELGAMSGETRSSHFEAIDKIMRAHRPGAEIMLPGTLRVRRQYGLLVFSVSSSDQQFLSDYVFEVDGPGTWDLGSDIGVLKISKGVVSENSLRTECGQIPFKQLFLDGAKVKFPLKVRSRRPGDRFRPFGAPGECKLKKFLISRRVPRQVRDMIPLLVQGDEILAVAGTEVSHHYRITGRCVNGLRIYWDAPKRLIGRYFPQIGLE